MRCWNRWIVAGPGAIWLLAMLAVSSCGWLGDPREKAQAAFEKGDLTAARIEATNAVEKYPRDGDVYLLLGRILTEMGDFLTADRTLKKARELGGDRSRVDPLLARVLLKIQAYQRVIDELPVDAAHPGEARAAVSSARGQAYLALRKVDEAKVAFAAALEASPASPDARVGQAQIVAIDGDQAGALALVDQVLAKAPRSADAWMLKATLLRLQGKVDDAMAAYEAWARLDVTSLMPRIAAADMLIASGRFDDAQKQVNAVLGKAPGSVLGNHAQARLYYAQGRYDKARDALQTVLKAQPKYVPGVLLMSMIQLATGALNQAEEGFRSLLAANPQDLATRKLYAATLMRMGNAKGAIDTLTPVLQKVADDPELLSIAAQAHMQVRDFSKATTYLEQAARLRADDTGALIRLAVARMSGGEAQLGLRELERAAALDQDGVAAEFVMANAFLNQRAHDKALAVAQSIQRKQPKNPLGFNLAGVAHGRLGDLASARKDFEQAVALDAGYWPAAGNLARLDLAAGKREAATKHVEKVLDSSSGNFEAMFALSELSGDRGRYIRSLEAARQADAKAYAPRALLARAYIAHGLGERALVVAQEATAIAPSLPDAIEILGTAQLVADRKSESLATFRRLTTDHPRSAGAQLRLAQAHLALVDRRSAEAALNKALALQPEYADALVVLAQVHAQADRFDEALKVAARIRERMPKAPLGFALTGDLMMSQGKYVDAVKAYEAGLAVAPVGALLLKRHMAMTATGHNPGLDALKQWLEQHPNTPEMRIYLASQQYQTGEFAQAIENYRKVADLDPYNALALNNLANAYHQIKDPRALAAAEAAYALRPDDADILDTYGMLLTEAGKIEHGMEILKKALARNPKSAEIRMHYAIALARSGDRARARSELQQIVSGERKFQLSAEARAILDKP